MLRKLEHRCDYEKIRRQYVQNAIDKMGNEMIGDGMYGDEDFEEPSRGDFILSFFKDWGKLHCFNCFGFCIIIVCKNTQSTQSSSKLEP